MLCEVKILPKKKQKETLRKVHCWYMGNRHVLKSGPRFGKSAKSAASCLMTKHNQSVRTSSRKNPVNITRSSSNKENNYVNKKEDFKEPCDEHSSVNWFMDSVNLANECTDNGPSSYGDDFLTSKFMMDLHSNKLSLHEDSAIGGTFTRDITSCGNFNGSDIKGNQGSVFSHSTYHINHPYVHNFSPSGHLKGDSSADSEGDENMSSRVSGGFGSVDIVDFQSDVRCLVSRGQTVTESGHRIMSQDQTSSELCGLPKRMVHSIASLVNPHAKLAESEARKTELEYLLEKKKTMKANNKGSKICENAPVPYVLKAVNISSIKPDVTNTFSNFKHDYMYGQDILSKVSFVGRSGTALDVRYSAHAQGDAPENHTNEVISLYNMLHGVKKANATQEISDESKLFNQSLEEFYQTVDSYSPTHIPKYPSSSRAQSTKSRSKSAKTVSTSVNSSITVQPRQANRKLTAKTLCATVNQHKEFTDKNTDDDDDEILYSTFTNRPRSAVKLDVLVNLIDHVKDEMIYFREKLAPTPMPGFQQPASTSVSNKPLSRPASTASRNSQLTSSQPHFVHIRPASPQARPGTPIENDDTMLDEPEVHSDQFKHALPNQLHSANINKAVDWRGKIMPEPNKIWCKMRFGGHSYIQKLKPSLRTAGALSAGKRPKTAPTFVREHSNNKQKVESITLPEVTIQKYPSVVSNYPFYPVKHRDEKVVPILITLTECDKNERVPAQAASNTMTQVDDQDMDRIMSIQHILGSSDSRYGSLGSLFLDEDFLRSINSHYTAASSMSLTSSGSQNKEYLSFVSSTHCHSLSERKLPSKHSAVKKPEVDKIPEEMTSKEDDLSYAVIEDLQHSHVQETFGDIQDSQSPQKLITVQTDLPDEGLVKHNEGLSSEVVSHQFYDSNMQKADRNEDVHKKMTALLTTTTHTPASVLQQTTDNLTKSEIWYYQNDPDKHEQITGTNVTAEVPAPQQHSDQNDKQQQHPSKSRHWAKSLLKPENYCFQCLPDSMTSKVGRSAGCMPGGSHSPSGQVLCMARRQNEYFKKAPPVRTPPSIPSPHHSLGGRSPRQGQQYISELEHHARKVKSPRHFMEQERSERDRKKLLRVTNPEKIKRGSPVVELRKDNCRSAPPGARQEVEDILVPLSIKSLHAPVRAQTAPATQSHLQSPDKLQASCPLLSEEGRVDESSESTVTNSSFSKYNFQPKSSKLLAQQGRPIPDVLQVEDPDELAAVVLKQKQAKAAVDIQRIFRGYVCRNKYKMLLWENRKQMEDKQMALMESQKEYHNHQLRMDRIYNRPPLDHSLLQWAHEFKKTQIENKEKREFKKDVISREMMANQQKAKCKIEVIGPHIEIYDIYHPKEVGPSKRNIYRAAVQIQKYVRGFLVRKKFEKLRRKATFCGSSWQKIVKDYKSLLIQVQRWHAVDKPVTPFSLEDMHEYMDMRRRYESQFDKKAFGGEMEQADLQAFFHECDLYPSSTEIEEGLDVITNGQSIKIGNAIKKNEAMNLLYYIYVPKATGLNNTRQSTWMNPIIDGVEVRKLLYNEYVEPAPLKPCADLVMSSCKERKLREYEEKEKQLIEKHAKGEDVAFHSESES